MIFPGSGRRPHQLRIQSMRNGSRSEASTRSGGSSRCGRLGTPTHGTPAARVERRPVIESSNATHRPGAGPRRAQAARYISGAGLACMTSSAHRLTGNTSPARRRAASSSDRGELLATATGTRAAAAATTSCAPGMACALDATTSLTSPSSSASSTGARPGSSNNTVRSAQAAGIVRPINSAFCSGPNDSPRRANSSVSATVQHGFGVDQQPFAVEHYGRRTPGPSFLRRHAHVVPDLGATPTPRAGRP